MSSPDVSQSSQIGLIAELLPRGISFRRTQVWRTKAEEAPTCNLLDGKRDAIQSYKNSYVGSIDEEEGKRTPSRSERTRSAARVGSQRDGRERMFVNAAPVLVRPHLR